MARPSATVAPSVCLDVALVALLLSPPPASRRAPPPMPRLSWRARRAAVASGARRAGAPTPYVDYLYLYYCVIGGERRPVLGCAAMAAWLVVLFYLLTDTAVAYFCSSLEGLSRMLRLPPAITGATLLSLGNGAPDALSALPSFKAEDGRGDGGGGAAAAAVGLSGVLGGAMFVSAAVLSVVAIRAGSQGVAVDRDSFFRDAAFLLLALAVLFYLLVDTAAAYFCSSLEGLSRMLRLPLAITEATLLSLENDAPNTLSALASFKAEDGRDEDGGRAAAAAVGLSAVLGGAMFVSAAVLGVVAIRAGGQGVAVDRNNFFRHAAFLLLALATVAIVITAGEVGIWGAVAYRIHRLYAVLPNASLPELGGIEVRVDAKSR